jgi:predicted dehydrogenase
MMMHPILTNLMNNTRRSFLKKSALALGFPTIIPATAIGKGGRPAPSERITVGLIGYGTIAIDWTGNFLNDERVQVVAVADPMKKYGHYGYKGEKMGGRDVAVERVDSYYSSAANKPVKTCAAYVDFREMLEKEDLNAIQISTPDHWHAYQAIYAARKGLHIYGQKPLSLNIGDGRRMVDEVQKAGITWQTGSQQRSDLKFRLACELVRNGRIGKLKRVRVGLPGGHSDWNQMANQKDPAPVPADFDYDLWLGPAEQMDYRPAILPLNWRHNFNFSGGMITDFGAHHIDIAHWGMDADKTGPVAMKNIKGTLSKPKELYNTATAFHFECVYANGVEMVVADKSEALMPEVVGTAGAGKSFDHTGVFFEGEDGKWIWVNRDKISASDINILRQVPQAGEIKLYESKEHTKNFIDCIYSGETTITPIETSHRSISVAHLANVALRAGAEKLEWDPAKEVIVGNDKASALLSREWRKPWTLA